MRSHALLSSTAEDRGEFLTWSVYSETAKLIWGTDLELINHWSDSMRLLVQGDIEGLRKRGKEVALALWKEGQLLEFCNTWYDTRPAVW